MTRYAIVYMAATELGISGRDVGQMPGMNGFAAARARRLGEDAKLKLGLHLPGRPHPYFNNCPPSPMCERSLSVYANP